MHFPIPTRAAARVLFLPVALIALLVAGCGDDEVAAPEAGHTPESVKLFVDDVDVTANLVLAAGAVTRVEVRYYDHDDNLITGIEDSHHTAMVFTPATLATSIADVPDHNFQQDVTAQASAGAGTVMIGYGHDVAADELTFGPFPVTVP